MVRALSVARLQHDHEEVHGLQRAVPRLAAAPAPAVRPPGASAVRARRVPLRRRRQSLAAWRCCGFLRM
eukprot:2856192-Alexandrium_andersonii.AAC.1